MGFNDLMRNKGNALQKLQQSVAESKGSGAKDPRVWKLSVDENFNGSALVRILPWGDGNRTFWAEWAEVSFTGKGGRYWNRSLRSLGQNDPVGDLASCLWDKAKAAGEDFKAKVPQPNVAQARRFGTQTKYVCNIFVLEDPRNPSNVGKVMLYKYSPSIHKKIQDALTPLYQDIKPVQVSDLIDGANLRVRSKGKKYGDKLNYDYSDSAFEAPAPLHSDTKVLENIYNQMHDLTEFEDPSNYKSYEELEKEMIKALGQQYVSDARGETFNAAMAAQSGTTPFESSQQPQQSGGGQQQQQQADPFASASQGGNNDPFASASQGGNNDPFASVGNDQQQQQQQADPFASSQQDSGNQQADPFASVGNDQQQQQQQQQQADPFASVGNDQQQQQQQQQQADPFASVGNDQQQQQQQADPFASSQQPQQTDGGQQQQADPFASSQQDSGNQQADPFASIEM